MGNLDLLEETLLKKLKKLNPNKIILFGSYAWGNPGSTSDIDLLIVTNDQFMPSSFHEKNVIYFKWARAIKSIEKDYPIDLIVHTLPMHKKFIELNSSFSKEILNKGKVLYERNN